MTTIETFKVVLHEDVLSAAGNIIARAGEYDASQAYDAPEGVVTIFSPEHYAARGQGMNVTLPPHLWAFPEEKQRPVPEHVCVDNARSSVCSTFIYCGVCREVIA